MPTFRLLVPLPVVVNGGITMWKVQAETYGKGHGRMQVVAECLSDGRRIVITNGREGAIARHIRLGVTVRPGTIAAKIFAKLVREGRAVVVS